MIRKLLCVLIGAAAFLTWGAATVSANHEGLIWGPCGQETGYLHMTPEKVRTKVDRRIRRGELAPATVLLYNEIVLSGTPHDLLIAAGVIQEYAVNRFDQVLRYDDPWWAEMRTATMTEFQVGCAGGLWIGP